MKVFVIGIAGGTGVRLAKLLAEQGDQVFGLYRKPEQIAMLHAVGATGVLGDLAAISEQELASASSGADVVVFTAGAGEQDNDSMTDAVDGDGVRKAIAAAHLANIPRLLLVSVFPEAWRERNMPKSFQHYMAVKKRADVELVHSDLEWIILRPAALTDQPGKGSVNLSRAEIHTEISRDDVAATIATLLHAPKLQKIVLEVTAGATRIASAVAALNLAPPSATQNDAQITSPESS
jgi:uncharacterized protein YbjT (DUF2867 family)